MNLGLSRVLTFVPLGLRGYPLGKMIDGHVGRSTSIGMVCSRSGIEEGDLGDTS